MGDPRKIRPTYQGPSHPWQKSRIESDRVLAIDYGLKSMTEIWKTDSLLKKFTTIAKNLIPRRDAQAAKEKEQLLTRLSTLGLMQAGAKIEDVLNLDVRALLERRLQSFVFKKGLAKSMKQARQFITHEHVMINGKKITSPAYLISKHEEGLISFSIDSPYNAPDHPERVVVVKEEPVKVEKKDVSKEEKKHEKKEDKVEVKQEKTEVKHDVKEEKPKKEAKKPAKKEPKAKDEKGVAE
jgi:small subunit ribosomal protein S4